MDKDELKALMLDFLNKLEADGYRIEFAGLPPWLPDYDEPYNLQIYSAQFTKTGIMSAISLLVNRFHAQFPAEIRRHINRFDICRTPEDIACRAEDILINKIKYRGLSIPYRMLLDYA